MAEQISLNDRIRFSKMGHPSRVGSVAATAGLVTALNPVTDGTAATGVTATEKGYGRQRLTSLALGDKAGGLAFTTIGGGANLGVGALIYTFPAGDFVVNSVSLESVTLTEDDGYITGDDPDVGLGTTLATGVQALLSAITGAENILTGQTSVNLAVTDVIVATAVGVLAADAHTLYLNAADGWAANGEDDMSATGTIHIDWTFLG